ncbi:DUF4038 domain-containing protein [Janibacter sp. DB-40]|uniref:apiosidase-like domain-containing protein n=1 Tax=Janibacter sp. DB-40 TaxID=3028808 RepID=UPI002407750F|nr:DUF4038 domain-containing protein [Janibacter sp. DB-40]
MLRYLIVAAAVLALVATAVVVLRPGDGGSGPPPAAGQRPPSEPTTGQRTPSEQVTGQRAPTSDSGERFVWSVSDDRRHLVDQHGDPVLVRGDSPWSLMTDLTPDEAETYFADRGDRDVNAVIVSLLGAVANGAPHDDGSTVDGLAPFVEGDVTEWSPDYWGRAHDYVARAERHGITVMLYPIDSWVWGKAFTPDGMQQCRTYGRQVAEHFADLPNIVWMAGGDYYPASDAPGEIDRCVAAVREGMRDVGDQRPFTMQLGAAGPVVTTDHPWWRRGVDWNFVYTYDPTHAAVARAYSHQPPVPTLLGEANYERENNQGNQPTTSETLRRQVAWALTSGAVGDFYGSSDWGFAPGWQERLGSPGLADVGHVRDVFAGVEWWRLVPDAKGAFLTGGRGEAWERGDVLDSDLATATIAPDGSVAVVYVPTQRTITIETGALADDVSASWVDPSTGQTQPAGVQPQYRTPGQNGDGDGDWLLVFTSPG